MLLQMHVNSSVNHCGGACLGLLWLWCAHEENGIGGNERVASALGWQLEVFIKLKNKIKR